MSESRKSRLVRAAKEGDLDFISKAREAAPIDGSTMQDMACAAAIASRTDVLAYTLSNGASLQNNTDLITSALDSVDPRACFKTLLSAPYNLDPNFNLGHSGTLLTAAVTKKDVPFLKILLDGGADPNRGGLGTAKISPLEAAAIFGTDEILDLLIDAGARTQDSGALQAAAQRQREPAVRKLLARGADPNELVASPRKQKRLPRTALGEAVVNGNVDIAEVLIEAGANVDAKDCNGKTVLDLAREEGNADIKNLFNAKGIPD